MRRLPKILLATLLLVPLPAPAHSLEHSKWVEADPDGCPDAIYFGVRRYLFLNACRATAADGVVERGKYSIAGDLILLAERQAAAPQGLRGIPPGVAEIRIVERSAERLVLRVGERTLRFRSARRGSYLKTGGAAQHPAAVIRTGS